MTEVLGKRTKENLFWRAKLWCNLDQNQTINLFKEAGIEGKFDVERWDEYMAALRAKQPYHPQIPLCEVCGGAMESVRRWATPETYVCVTHPVHTSATKIASLIMLTDRTKTRKEAIALAMGWECEHGLELAECRPCCMKKLHDKEIELMKEA